MKETQILFKAPMVRAILDGSKVQTRRIVKEKDYPIAFSGFTDEFVCLPENYLNFSPYGQVGDCLWVRETWGCMIDVNEIYINYKADDEWLKMMLADFDDKELAQAKRWDKKLGEWHPSIFMPRWASRIDLEITGIRVERLQDISESDCFSEGIERLSPDEYYQNHASIKIGNGYHNFHTAKDCYEFLWKHINGNDSWEANPFVWVIEFKRI